MKLLKPRSFQFGLHIFKILALEGLAPGHPEPEFVKRSSLPIRHSEVAVIHPEVLAEIGFVVRRDIAPAVRMIRTFPISRCFPRGADILRARALQDFPRRGSPLRTVTLDREENMAALNSALVLFGHHLGSSG